MLNEKSVSALVFIAPFIYTRSILCSWNKLSRFIRGNGHHRPLQRIQEGSLLWSGLWVNIFFLSYDESCSFILVGRWLVQVLCLPMMTSMNYFCIGVAQETIALNG